MTVEIIKLYENAGAELKKYCRPNCERLKSDVGGDYRIYIYCDSQSESPETCPYAKEQYSPFTAEKQLAVFKIFCKRYLEVSQHVEENGDLCFGIKATIGDYAVSFNKDFAECLAGFVNYLWQDLTEEERKQIADILKG